MEREIESRVSSGQFMGSVLVARDGRILLSKGYGKPDLDWQIPNSPTTKFRLASVTKQFTAACILLLAERGKLKIDDPVNMYVPDAPATWEPITIFNLLTHTSGLHDFMNDRDNIALSYTPTRPEQLIGRFRDKPLEFPPGSSWRYSNSNYVVLGYLIEKLSGESYARFVQDNIFSPVGMKDSGYDSTTAVIEQRATGYMRGASGPTKAPYYDNSVVYSAGGLYSTTQDLLKWEEALFGGKVVSPASLARMTTPFRAGYAFGLMVRHAPNGDRIIFHGGRTEGFTADLEYIRAEKIVVVALANIDTPATALIGYNLSRIAHDEAPVRVSLAGKATTERAFQITH
jgi:CubicO group peptidase (beta-lactamase class C family)